MSSRARAHLNTIRCCERDDRGGRHRADGRRADDRRSTAVARGNV